MKPFHVIFFFLVCQLYVNANCTIGSVVISDNQDVLAFESTHANCTNVTINGDLTISGNVDNISGLSKIANIRGGAYINGTNLLNLEGLENIVSIRFTLAIENNNSLESIVDHSNGIGLVSLTNGISDQMRIINNSMLNGSLFPNNLETVRSVVIIRNHSLQSVTFNNVIEVKGLLNIEDNDDIEVIDMQGLTEKFNREVRIAYNTSLESIISPVDVYEAASISLINNPALINMTEWSSLEKIGRHLDINSPTNNSSTDLVEINQFPELTDIGWRLEISNNPALENIDFPKLSGPIGPTPTSSRYRLIISNNSELESINMPFLQRVNGDFVVDNNDELTSSNLNFSNISYVHRLKISRNNILEDILWLSGLPNNGIGVSFLIHDNAELETCNINSICFFDQLSSVNPNSKAYNNLNCCEDISEIINSCNDECCVEPERIVINACKELVIESENGTCYKVLVTDDGNIITEEIPCN